MYHEITAHRRSIFNTFPGLSLLVLLSVLTVLCHSSYANGTTDPLVETMWLEKNLKNSSVRILHVGSLNPQSPQMFQQKHIPSSVYMSIADLMGSMGNGSAPPDTQKLDSYLGGKGISGDSQVVVVGGSDNPFTTAAFWLMKYNGHDNVTYLNGGVGKWIRENRVMSGNSRSPEKAVQYPSTPDDSSILATADHVLKNMKNPDVKILDVRSPGEFAGTENPTQAKRTGHIPRAINMEFYSTNLSKDGTFKSVDDLKAAYEAKGITKDKEIIVYCEGGVRAAHTHLVLKYMLGYPKVRNYVGSWGEWGNRLDPAVYPVEK